MDNNDDSFSMGQESRGYAITGKIMLSAIVILFGIVIFMVILHLYARWYITRVRRIGTTRTRNRVNRHTQIVFYVDNHLPGSAQVMNKGLEPEVLNSLPVFVYQSKKQDQKTGQEPGQEAGQVSVSECAVCLSEFEDGETGRVLPKCNHLFHIECIDMWFHSHSTCPLCRSPVEPVQKLVEPVRDVEQGSSSGLCHCGEESRRKSFDFSGVRIEIPRRTEFENEISLSSPRSHSFRSPGSRLSSIKRILSMNRKSPKGTSTSVATSSGVGTSCGDSVNGGFELESGLSQEQNRHLQN